MSPYRHVGAKAGGQAIDPARGHDMLREALRTHQADRPEVYAALSSVAGDISQRLRSYGSIRRVPAAATRNLRNQMYLEYDTLRLLTLTPARL